MSELIGQSHIQHQIDHTQYIQIHMSRIDHIESLLNRANALEKPNFKRYLPNIFTSFGIFFLGFGLTNLLSFCFGLIEKLNVWTFVIITIASGIVVINGYISEFSREANHKSLTTELLDILKNIKSINPIK